MKKLLALGMILLGVTAMAADQATTQPQQPFVNVLSFKGTETLKDIQDGKVTETIRLGDRSQAPSSFVIGMVLPLTNSDKTQDARSFEDQIKADAYKFVELTTISVSQFTALSQADQDEVKKYYAQDKIDAAKGIVSKVTFKFRSTK